MLNTLALLLAIYMAGFTACLKLTNKLPRGSWTSDKPVTVMLGSCSFVLTLSSSWFGLAWILLGVYLYIAAGLALVRGCGRIAGRTSVVPRALAVCNVASRAFRRANGAAVGVMTRFIRYAYSMTTASKALLQQLALVLLYITGLASAGFSGIRSACTE